MKCLGGRLDREKAVSPPPMPDVSLSLVAASVEDHVSVEKENIILKQRVELMEKEVAKLYKISADVRRCSSALYASSSVSIGSVNEEVLVT